MIFADKFNEIINILDSKFQALSRRNPNPADKGELCEIFIKEALAEIVAGNLHAVRGGHIVDSTGKRSNQIDVILQWRTALRIFSDKGLYPIEIVSAAFSVTATLTKKKLEEDIKVLTSIPTENPQYIPQISELLKDKALEIKAIDHWKRINPFRCIFGFHGEPEMGWLEVLNAPINSGQIKWENMPDLIIVNKKGVFQKFDTNNRGEDTDLFAGKGPGTYYLFVPYLVKGQYYWWLPMVLSSLVKASLWQNIFTPDYGTYFEHDLNAITLGTDPAN